MRNMAMETFKILNELDLLVKQETRYNFKHWNILQVPEVDKTG